MKTYTVSYSGNSTRFKNLETQVNADSEREAVETIYQQYMDENYFPQEDGSIKDCDGHVIAEADDDTIEYDGGHFYAEEYFEPVFYLKWTRTGDYYTNHYGEKLAFDNEDEAEQEAERISKELHLIDEYKDVVDENGMVFIPDWKAISRDESSGGKFEQALYVIEE